MHLVAHLATRPRKFERANSSDEKSSVQIELGALIELEDLWVDILGRVDILDTTKEGGR